MKFCFADIDECSTNSAVVKTPNAITLLVVLVASVILDSLAMDLTAIVCYSFILLSRMHCGLILVILTICCFEPSCRPTTFFLFFIQRFSFLCIIRYFISHCEHYNDVFDDCVIIGQIN